MYLLSVSFYCLRVYLYILLHSNWASLRMAQPAGHTPSLHIEAMQGQGAGGKMTQWLLFWGSITQQIKVY